MQDQLLSGVLKSASKRFLCPSSGLTMRLYPPRYTTNLRWLAKTIVHPGPEQERALKLFRLRERLRIDAYAGTGKTTTLRFLAESSRQRGLYLAFNRSIADAAKRAFPATVACTTSHSLAYRGVARHFGYPEWKLTGAVTPNTILDQFRMPDVIGFHSGTVLTKWSYSSILLHTVRFFLQSQDEELRAHHIPRWGILETLPNEGFAQFCEQALEHAKSIWHAMLHKTAGLPLGHDGYLKLWALSRPRASADYILVDEAQDLNPVLLGVLKEQVCQLVYVGDPYQQIYEWRGAVNAMEQVVTEHRVLLSQSYRFGPVIAEAATAILRALGAKEPVRGLNSIHSHLAQVHPQVILARSNVGVIGNVLSSLAHGKKCHVLGGTKGLNLLLEDVQRIREGLAGTSPELLGFKNWKEVLAFSSQSEGEHLRGLVNLVQEYGERTMLSALSRCVQSEAEAQVLCSTAHKAKGREWDYVRIDPDFLATPPKAQRAGRRDVEAAELRLLYVAVTRAKIAVDLPIPLLKRFELRRTTEEVLGGEVATAADPTEITAPNPLLQGVVSPYHSPSTNESKEMVALRRILGPAYRQ